MIETHARHEPCTHANTHTYTYKLSRTGPSDTQAFTRIHISGKTWHEFMHGGKEVSHEFMLAYTCVHTHTKLCRASTHTNACKSAHTKKHLTCA